MNVKMGLREANQNFSKAIKAVKAGNIVVLTERGQPIAKIQPIKAGETLEDHLQRLRDEGILIAPADSRPMKPGKPIRSKGKSTTKILREERDAR